MENQNINQKNLPIFLSAFVEKNDIPLKAIAKSIGCSVPTLNRIIAQKTFATEKLIKQCGIVFGIGYEKYKKLSDAEKETISENMGAVSGAGLGFASISSAVSVLGTTGLSAAGITSGLGVLGSLVGGGMMAGVAVAASIPIAVGAAGYGVMKGIKSLFMNMKLNNENIDEEWEFEKK